MSMVLQRCRSLPIGAVTIGILLLILGTNRYGHRRGPKTLTEAVGTRPVPIAVARLPKPQPPPRVQYEPGSQADQGGIRQKTKIPETAGSSAIPTGSTGRSNIEVTIPSKKTKAVSDPWARVALSFVGLDEEATAYWMEAINDASLPSEERKDLIEDLNEDGFRDPEHPAPDEYPVILNRLMLLEAMAPSAMDETNFAAMAEAFKDLINMARDMGTE